MNDPENFISRWSRRKREATDENAQPEKTAAEKAHEANGTCRGCKSRRARLRNGSAAGS